MRSQKGLVFLGVIALVTAFGFWGCGDDDDSNPVNWGSLEDPEFQAVNSQFEQFVDSTLTFFHEGLGSISNLPGDGTTDPIHYGPGDPGATTDSLSVSYNGGWHIVHLSWHNATDYAAVVNDSIQFIRDGVPSQEPADLEQLQYRHHWSWNAPDTTVTHINGEGHLGISFTGLDTQEATVNGTQDFTWGWDFVSADSTVRRDINVDATLSDFTIQKTQVGWAQGCPSAGLLSATVTMTYQKDDGAEVQSTWNFNVTFENGTTTTTVTSNGVTWTYSRQECIAPSA